MALINLRSAYANDLERGDNRGASGGSTFVDGGIVGQVQSRTDSFERLTKFLLTPNGAEWVAKEVALQRMNPRGSVPDQVKNPQIQQFTPLNILTGLATQMVGKQLFRYGTSQLQVDWESYNAIKQREIASNDPLKNPLVQLYNRLIGTEENIIQDYPGGPGSVYGIGRTTIHRVYNTQETSKSEFYRQERVPEDGPGTAKAFYRENPTGSLVPIHREVFYNGKRPSPLATTGPDTYTRDNYRKEVGPEFAPTGSGIEDKRTRIGLGDPGANPGLSGRDPLVFNEATQDKINRQSVSYRERNGNASTFHYVTAGTLTKSKPVTRPEDFVGKDIIKFRIEIIDNLHPENTFFMAFRALIVDINDTYQQQRTSYRYLGRGEDFYTYNGFRRDINVGFHALAQTRWEMKPMYQKMQTLAASMAPDYRGGVAKGCIAKLTIGDYLYEQPGFIDNLNVKPMSDLPWDIAVVQADKPDMYELPMGLECSMNFTPIHNFVPKFSLHENRFFLPLSDEKGWYNDMKTLWNRNSKSGQNQSDQPTTGRVSGKETISLRSTYNQDVFSA